jgi:hypothetical protein
MKCTLTKTEIKDYSQRYAYPKADLEKFIINEITPLVKQNGYVDYESFLTVCGWKTERSKTTCQRNDKAFVEEITFIALGAKTERTRIETLTLLDGVSWPTASVFLHFFHEDKYPIIDYRALETLGEEKPSVYSFKFWWKYVECCRKLADKTGFDMRTIDKALWQYSVENEKQRS